jgi:two-component system cell cycle sensor histidine kinase/response regulator CckA
VVEDEEAVRELIEITLDRAGVTVLAAESAEQALAIAATLDRAIDVLLTDRTLPSMDGYALAEELCSQGQVTHVIYMSGFAEASPPDHGGRRPHYLTKPFTMPDLTSLLRDIVSGSDGRTDT